METVSYHTLLLRGVRPRKMRLDVKTSNAGCDFNNTQYKSPEQSKQLFQVTLKYSSLILDRKKGTPRTQNTQLL